MEVDALSKGLMFKVKDAGGTTKPSLQKDTLGWAIVQPDSLLWEAGMADSASKLYQGDLDHTLEFELVHPTELVTGMSGKIHLLCRPASDSDVEECRKNGWGYFKPYTRDDRATAEIHGVDRATTPPLLEAMQEEELPPGMYTRCVSELDLFVLMSILTPFFKVPKPTVGAELL
jgi:hypothetical protein